MPDLSLDHNFSTCSSARWDTTATRLLCDPSGLTPATLPWCWWGPAVSGGKLLALGRESLHGVFQGSARQDLQPVGEHQPWYPRSVRIWAGMGRGRELLQKYFCKEQRGESACFEPLLSDLPPLSLFLWAEFFWKVTEETCRVLLARDFACWKQIIMFCCCVSF